ncbi:hypothetical protein TWF694_005794 [Orbilia ellipsospora]|uniref:Peptidase S8/S53 domain-containing protein n=1 Tax=Orbilia ellipsospora TaxID=2528407 RepID=A0AAV9WY18_9PEZI
MQAGNANQMSLFTLVRRAAFDQADLKIWLPKIRQCLQDGADPNNTNTSMGKSPLHAVAEQGMVEVAQLLLKYGADPNLKTNKGAIPLHFAVQYGYVELVELLLKNNSDPNSEADGCLTPLLLVSACYEGQRPPASTAPVKGTDVLALRIARLLIEYGADPTIQDGVTGQTPLHHAMAFTPIPVDYVKLLIRSGAQPLVKNNSGQSVFDLFYDSGYTKSKDKDLILDIMTNAPASIEERMQRMALGKETKLAEREVLYQHGSTQSKGSPTDLAESWFKNVERLSYVLQQDPSSPVNYKRVRIAIIDSGIVPDHPQKDLVEDFEDFVNPGNTGRIDEHEVAHGSAGVSLVTRVAPESEIYVARVFQKSQATNETADLVAKAIRHAIENWRVDIITLASGFEPDGEYPALKQAIRECTSKGVLVFAAASNHGNENHITFPANMKNEVMCIFACNGQNKVDNKFNPQGRILCPNFAFLGEALRAYPGEKLRDGTSYATYLAAAVAALFIDFSRQKDVREKIEYVERLQSMDGISVMFMDMAGRGRVWGEYSCVVPWEYVNNRPLTRERERDLICGRLGTVLREAA